ncbi:MAG: DUF2897 family protein [Steroidobacteraceae bacterium]
MSASAAFIILLVVAMLVGGLLVLRNSAKSGMPSQEVLDRVKRREQDLEQAERHEQDQDR